ncbi:hypothetical protein HELRODRAFT_174907 [Helobdella robusta]|uniref:Magnesium transporter protein 1 n=1 Tax=Helobdella robusta TaxID=6412 RepID=T1F8L7_HELRO|nr:hypothetical protein HELRODRAFT_174907 [Helobdella robusta]ESO01352.1 hypothetical protein HELRODRAFT_174907 [Helobdella robusta]
MSARVAFSFFIFILFAPIESNKTDRRIEELKQLSARNGAILLDYFTFKNYVTKSKNYTVIMLLVAVRPERRCFTCGKVLEDFLVLTNSWKMSPDFNTDLFFAYADYDSKGERIFEYLKANSVPDMLVYSKERLTPIKVSLRSDTNPERLAKLLRSYVPYHIRIYRPWNYLNVAIMVAFSLIISKLLIKYRSTLYDFVSFASPSMCACFVMLMLSGHMWNHMNARSFVHGEGSDMKFIHPGRREQVVAETPIVFLIC